MYQRVRRWISKLHWASLLPLRHLEMHGWNWGSLCNKKWPKLSELSPYRRNRRSWGVRLRSCVFSFPWKSWTKRHIVSRRRCRHQPQGRLPLQRTLQRNFLANGVGVLEFCITFGMECLHCHLHSRHLQQPQDLLVNHREDPGHLLGPAQEGDLVLSWR